ncbi:MAG: hypothetical protein I4N51_02495, partial [Acinetobacter sp.]|nr:hypothetical protein [Acinetobacter sp.]
MAIALLFMNIRSVTKNKILFDQLLLDENINTFLLNETYLTPKMQCKIRNNQILRDDSKTNAQRANGGVLLGFQSSIAYRRHEPNLANLPEHLIATLYFKSIYITVATIYIRPKQPIPYEFFQYISNNFRNYIIMADINYHSRTDRQKTRFNTYITTNTTGEIHKLPRHTRPISNTSPDIVITSTNLTNRCQLEVLDTIGSDHDPIKLTLQCHNQTNYRQQQFIRTIPRYDKANWTKYRNTIEEKIENLNGPETENELYTTVEKMTTALKNAAKEHIPTTTSTTNKPKLPPQYPPMLKRSKQLYKEYLRTGNLEALRHHRRIQRTISNYLKAYKLRNWIKACNSLGETSHPTKYWKRFKMLTGQYTSTPYPLLQNNAALTTDEEKADAFAEYLQEVFTPPPRHNPYQHPVDRLNPDSQILQPNISHTMPDTNPLTVEITTEDINRSIKNKRNSAPGIDNISYRHIKEAPVLFINLLATIYTFILRTGFIPMDWKISKTLMFPKPNKPTNSVSSYRPIQLTTTFSKILERILVYRLHQHITEYNLLPLQQAGFRPN